MIDLKQSLFTSSTQCLIETDKPLYLSDAVGYLCQLGAQEALLCRQYLQIGRIAVLHGKGSALICCLQRFHLLLVQFRLVTRRLILCQGVVHLGSGLQKCLLETELSFFLLGLGWLFSTVR